MFNIDDSYDDVIHDIWKRFIDHRETPEDVKKLDPVIYGSWVRSRKMNVDPYNDKSIILEKNAMQKRLSDSKMLITVASSYMKKLSSFLSGEQFAVVIADADGIILDVAEGTGTGMMQDKLQTYMMAGASRNESYVGTTASGTCLVVDKPIIINGSEHYIEAHHIFSSAAVPIHFNEKIIGSIGIVGPKDAHSYHTLGMMVAAADGVEKEFELRNAYYEIQSRNSQIEGIFQSIASGIIMLDNNGVITQINNYVCKMFSLTKDFLLGKKFSNIIAVDSLEKPLHLIDKNIYSRDVALGLPHGRTLPVLLTACGIQNPNGIRIGTVLTFDEPKHVNRIVNRRSGFSARYTFDSIIGDSFLSKSAKDLALIASKNDSTVLITGESGTGKELFAQAIHNASDRANNPFIAINCASLPAELVESELFGYVGGAFTGASKDGQPGKFELADNGTLFLDEIGDMPFGIQATLLRVLQMKETIRIGGKKPIPINVRIIAATNKNLENEISLNAFRRDLYYRLNVFPISLAPLRDRREDIKPLLEYFAKTYGGKECGLESFSDEALAMLENYDWPGNTREMQNVIERAFILSQNKFITVSQLPAEIISGKVKSKVPQSVGQIKDGGEKEYTYFTHKNQITAMEMDIIISALKKTNGNISQAAHLLGISRQTLYYKLKHNNIDVSKYRFNF